MGVKVLDVILSAPRVDLSELRSTLDSLFFNQNYLTEILGITSSSNLELTRYIQLLTQANKKIHELQQELNLTAANQIDLKNASRQFVSNISTWWQNVGPGYVKDVQIKEGFAQATLSCAILDITDLFSTIAIEEPKQSVVKRLEALGFTIKSNGRDAFVENTAESLNTLTKLVKSQWASANIHKVNVAYDSNLNIMIISEIVILIYDLNEVLLSPATKSN